MVFGRYAALAALALLCCSALLINSSARAQCPDSTGPAPSPDSIAWIPDQWGQQYEVQIPGTDCYVTYDYCTREVADTLQIWVSDIIPDSSSDCDSLTPSELILDVSNMARDWVVSNDPVLSPCIKDEPSVVEETYLADCWSAQTNPCNTCVGRQASAGYFPCSFQAWCEETCDACFTPADQIQYSNCTTTNPYSSVICGPEPPGTPWPWNICFTLGCLLPGSGGDVIAHPLGVSVPTPIDSSLRLYPNPTTGQLSVTSIHAGIPVEVLDVLGRVVLNGEMPANGPLTLDVSTLPDGTYYINEGQTELKFVKN